MTDRTDFTQKPRTPAEKMREIENRLGLHAKGLIKWALRVKRLERDFAERIHHTINQDHVSGPVPAHPGGIGECSRRFHGEPCGLVEQRQSPFRVPLPADLSPDAEPPGSPTVEEAEDPVRASDWLRDLDEERVHQDQPRRECWEVLVSENDALKDLSAHKEKVIELLSAKLTAAQTAEHELKRENERLSSRVKELVSLVKALQRVAEAQCLAVNAEIQKRVAAETADREYREKIADWLAEMTDD